MTLSSFNIFFTFLRLTLLTHKLYCYFTWRCFYTSLFYLIRRLRFQCLSSDWSYCDLRTVSVWLCIVQQDPRYSVHRLYMFWDYIVLMDYILQIEIYGIFYIFFNVCELTPHFLVHNCSYKKNYRVLSWSALCSPCDKTCFWQTIVELLSKKHIKIPENWRYFLPKIKIEDIVIYAPICIM